MAFNPSMLKEHGTFGYKQLSNAILATTEKSCDSESKDIYIFISIYLYIHTHTIYIYIYWIV